MKTATCMIPYRDIKFGERVTCTFPVKKFARMEIITGTGNRYRLFTTEFNYYFKLTS